MPSKPIDLLINARWIIPVDPANRILDDYAVAIDNGRIVDILPQREAAERYSANSVNTLDRHALIPGLINAHTHAAMSLLRGIADDLPLMTWLQEHIWPAENRWVSPEFVRDGTQLAMVEMLRSGTTCFNDMYFFPDEASLEVENSGMRAVIGLIMLDFPTPWAQTPRDYLHKGLAVHDQLRNNPLIHTVMAPHAPYSVSDEPLSQVLMYAEELDIPIHMHVHETAFEVAQAVENSGITPIQRLKNLGLLGPRLMAVHMTQLNDDDMEAVASSGTHVIHCPESNLKLASGFCPLDQLLKNGVNVALGTDGAASNNDLDMFGEMRTAALLAKGVAGNAEAVPAMAALRMATINGARALGLDAEIGSIELGKSADLVAVRMDTAETVPVYSPVSQLVYAAGRDHVSDVWVAGHHLLKERRLTTLDEPMIRARANEWREKIYTSSKSPSE